MDIQKIRNPALPLAPPAVPRDAAVLPAPGKAGFADQPGEGSKREAKAGMPADAVASALQNLDPRNLSTAGDSRRQHAASLSNYAKQALSAYQAQQNQTNDEARSALSKMLGVDYYA